MGIPDRIRQVVNAYGSDLAEFSRLSGVPYRTLQNYLLGVRKQPRHDVLERICARTGVDMRWLLTGAGDMYVGGYNVGEEPGAWLPGNLAGHERRIDALLELLAEITPEERDAILDDAFARARTAQQMGQMRRDIAGLKRAG